MPKMNKDGWKHKEERDTLMCCKCGGNFDKSMFSPRGRTSAGTQKYDPRCKSCYKTFSSENFSSVRRAEKHRRVLLSIVESAKVCCSVCSYDKFKGALDFHHVDPTTKTAEIADMINIVRCKHTTPEQLINEIQKCVVLCSNCHRELHGGCIVL